MEYPVVCRTCGEAARFCVDEALGQVPLWVCPDGHGAVRRAGAFPLPRQRTGTGQPALAGPTGLIGLAGLVGLAELAGLTGLAELEAAHPAGW